ncbi:MAG TPA: fatty acid--CoA ligase family protein [Acidimicrobiales bacterium]|nr:fatty acid--CoA ligase family protein [Acidimicrobiales bacterium]
MDGAPVNLGLLLEMVADGGGDRVVLGSRPGGMTGSALLAAARAAASRFRASGAEYAGFLDLNSEAVPVALFGAALAGIPFVPVNYRLEDGHLAAILERIAPGVVVAGPGSAGRVPAGVGLSVVDPAELLAPAPPDAGELDWVDGESVAVLLFTSGTTGAPKAAVLRHRHLVSYIMSSVEFFSAGEDEAQLISVPPYHIAGVSSVLSSLYSGRRMVYLSGFDPHAWVGAVRAESVTQAMVVPTMLGRILDVLEQTGEGLPSLRHLSYGGGRMPVETIERAMATWPAVDFVNAYGLTETSSTVAILTPEDHREAVSSTEPSVRARLGSVGRPLPSVEISIRDDAGRPVPPGGRGEVWIRGDQVAGEYLGASLVDADGWFPTRDAGRLDDAGFLYLDGRLDDVIVRGGENLSPGEIEEVLLAHPAVRDAAVVGVPDPEWGEAVAAAVVLETGSSATAEELQAWVRGRLRSTRTPQTIQFRSELPYNETGKLLRRVIRDEVRAPAP